MELIRSIQELSLFDFWVFTPIKLENHQASITGKSKLFTELEDKSCN